MALNVITVRDVRAELGDLVKLSRKKGGLSQDELADRLHISRLTVSNLESGRNVNLDTLLKVLLYFDLLEKFRDSISDLKATYDYNSLY